LTGLSWIVLGFIVGAIGYCPLTDWHFKVLIKLGENDLPSSYIKYLSDRLTGLDLNEAFVDKITLCVFIAAFSISLFLNFRDFLRSGKKGINSGKI